MSADETDERPENGSRTLEESLEDQQQAHLTPFRQIMAQVIRDHPETRTSILEGMTHVHDFQEGVARTALDYSLDDLTKLPKRRDFVTKVDRALHHGANAPQQVQDRYLALKGGTYMLILDIDFFKGINDGLGHAYGDSALVQLAELLSAENREEPHRIGGEEFGLLLPRSDLEVAERTASRLVSAISEHTFELYGADPTERVPMAMTVSIGVGGIMYGKEASFPQLYEKADGALYVAKETGRNKYALDPELVTLPGQP